MKVGDPIVLLHGEDDSIQKENGRVKRVLVREGLGFIDVPSASAGEIAALVGMDSTAIGATICAADTPEALPMIKISPPAVKMICEANTSPLMGKEGKFVNSKQLEQQLER